MLLCWELGAGSGHLEVVGALGRRMADQGHAVWLVVRDPASARAFASTRGLPLLQAPCRQGVTRKRSPAISYSDLLLRCGYAEVRLLRALLDAWLTLIESIGPDLIIVDHGPTALLASRIAGIPAVCTGTGFVNPPPASPLPALLPWRHADLHDLHAVERTAAAAVNRAIRCYGAQPIKKLADLFPEGRVFLTTYPELDHYGARQGTVYWGAPGSRGSGDSPNWPKGAGERVFAYMHPDYPQFGTMIRQLAALGHPTLVVAPGIRPAWVQRYAAGPLRIQDRHVDLDGVAADCRIVICHGGHGTVAGLLRRGIAPIVVPNFVEQTMLAFHLGRSGLALAAHPDPRRHDYATMIAAAAESERHREAAARFAAAHPPDDDCTGALVKAVLQATAIGRPKRAVCRTDSAPRLVVAAVLYGDPPEESAELARRVEAETSILGANDEEIELIRGILTTHKESGDDIEGARYLGLIGPPKSGRGLIGGLLDAHVDIAVSHQLDVGRYLVAGFDSVDVRRLMVENSALMARMQWQWGRHAYAVPGQHHGGWRVLRYLGNTHTPDTDRAIAGDSDLRASFLSSLGNDPRFLLVVRNPRDAIAAMAGDPANDRLADAADRYFERCKACAALIEGCESDQIVTVCYEDMLNDPAGALTGICANLGVDANPDYIDDCRRIVFPAAAAAAASKSAVWRPQLTASVRARIRCFDFLARYRFEFSPAD